MIANCTCVSSVDGEWAEMGCALGIWTQGFRVARSYLSGFPELICALTTAICAWACGQVPPAPWSTSPHSGMQGIPQHRDGQHEPARLVVCLAKHVFRKGADGTFRFVLETFSGFVTPSPGPAAAAAGRILLERYRAVDVGRGRADRQKHLDGAPGQEQHRTSSPHARGARQHASLVRRVLGITPACAGSTPTTQARRPGIGDHPRMRGEHSSKVPRSASWQGSSPHARGAPRVMRSMHMPSGIIPACAGSTISVLFIVSCNWDHPRMRGEHLPGAHGGLLHGGSSPHARGALPALSNLYSGMGIIPACAGSTYSSLKHGANGGDHPRMRGEHSGLVNGKLCGLGSSPHARGALLQASSKAGRSGIIPACAGSTPYNFKRAATDGDHPRMRGEHAFPWCSRWRLQGSSPHARGAQTKTQANAHTCGIIPACAGST